MMAICLLWTMLMMVGSLPFGPVQQAELKSAETALVWEQGEGFQIRYKGRPVFVPYYNQLTIHNREWTKALYRAPNNFTKAEKGRSSLTVRYEGSGMNWQQRFTVGPGNRVRIEYLYRQNEWDNAGLELGVARPVESFWAGSLADILDRPKAERVLIPPHYNPLIGSHPLQNTGHFRLRSRFGTLTWKSSEPVMLWDYPDRNGAFVIGFDKPVARGATKSFIVDIIFSEDKVKENGLIIDRVEYPSRVEDGYVRVQAHLMQAKNGPGQVKARLRLKDGPVVESALLALKPTPSVWDIAIPVLQEGKCRAVFSLLSAGGKELLRLPEMPMQVGPLAAMGPDRDYYTSERQGSITVNTVPALKNKEVVLAIERGGQALTPPASFKGGSRYSVRFPLDALPMDESQLDCRLMFKGRELLSARYTIRKHPPRPNEAKIDYNRRGLIVNGLPYFPFGFYSDRDPAASLAGEEAPQGFTLLSPYQGSAKGRSESDWESIRAYMDRAAALGMKVNYHLMGTATLPPSEEKWALLKAEVEMFRDHPALLSWYISDEPDGQGIAPALLEESYRFIKNLDPYHPITIVLMSPSRVKDYLKCMDILMVDPYPIPNAPVTRVSEWADTMNRAANYRMPLWIVPQAFGGGEWWAREPSAREERVMTYLALIHGATGIQYFVRRAPVGNPISPSLWSECRRLALEGAELASALLSEEPRLKAASSGAIHAAARYDRGYAVVLAANTENRPGPLKIKVQDATHTGQAEVLFENRTVAVKNGVVEDIIDAFGTRAYRFPMLASGLPWKESLKVASKNLTANSSFEQSANAGTPDGCYVYVGTDKGASLFVDPRMAAHGLHSLRITCPAEGQGLSLSPFPIQLEAGKRYRLSIRARGESDGLRFHITLPGLDREDQDYTLTTEWKEYVLSGTAKTGGRVNINYKLISAGTAWFDLLQVVSE
ncbi:MAG: hypothetical protein IT210_05250 [Armatimonadetes bacterium]|nr:hypothetical protein [Armatimonadota bacterium]